MFKTPQVENITDFRANYKVTLEKLAAGPVFLLQRGDVAGVLLSREIYDSLIEQIEEMEDIIAMNEYEQRKANGQLSYRTVSPNELAEWMSDAVPA